MASKETAELVDKGKEKIDEVSKKTKKAVKTAKNDVKNTLDL